MEAGMLELPPWAYSRTVTLRNPLVLLVTRLVLHVWRCYDAHWDDSYAWVDVTDGVAGLVAGAAASVAVLLLVWARLYLCLAHYWCVPASSDACGSRWSLTRYPEDGLCYG